MKQSLGWRNMNGPQDMFNKHKIFPRKDTVVVPFGGHTVIRFTVDNPGWWFLHCHIEIHQLGGMAAVVRELPNEILPTAQPIHARITNQYHAAGIISTDDDNTIACCYQCYLYVKPFDC